MTRDDLIDSNGGKLVECDALARHDQDVRRRKYSRFILASLGSVPWVGGFLAAMAARDAEKERREVNDIHSRWLEEHQRKIEELGATLAEIMMRVEQLGPEASERLENDDYLSLVRQGFRTWDNSATKEKRDLVKRLITNAAGTTLCTDDIVRLFIDWIDGYHEIHFAVIRAIYDHPGITRGGIWADIYGPVPREDSAEADLFKLLMRDLSTGGIVRQHRETTWDGQYKRKTKKTRSSSTLKSAFDTVDSYELTQLGSQFVHYTMEDVAPRLGQDRNDRDA